MRIYQAGPLFTEAERLWHQNFKEKFAAAGHEVQWPGDFFTQQEIDAWGGDAPRKIMERDRAAIDDCDVVVALLDGAQVDDGTAWEIGYAYAKGKPVIGIRTDIRNAGDTVHGKVNAMIEGSCFAVVDDPCAVFDQLTSLPSEKDGIVAYCKNCGGVFSQRAKIIIAEEDVEWDGSDQNGDVREDDMGPRNVHIGRYSSTCPICHNVVEATFYTEEYPIGCNAGSEEPMLYNLEFENPKEKYEYDCSKSLEDNYDNQV
ncbi:MAG: nucleoside 2-deoxyribosyltransferase [Desulfovibrio sp.]|nr:nucleoside 2-deoxyribosyltransferase [Desulfovibrio sp.]